MDATELRMEEISLQIDNTIKLMKPVTVKMCRYCTLSAILFQTLQTILKYFTHNTSAWALTMPHCYPFMIQIPHSHDIILYVLKQQMLLDGIVVFLVNVQSEGLETINKNMIQL